MLWVSKDIITMYSTVHWFHVMSVERYHYYVQYSTLISCRECRKMYFNRYMNGTLISCHECRKISLLCTVQYIDFMSWVSKDIITMYSTVHWFHVVSVERCILIDIWMVQCYLKYMSWVSKDAFLIDIWMVHWFHVVSVERCILIVQCTIQYNIECINACRECWNIKDSIQ